MKNSVSLLWLEGIQPEQMPALPSIASLLSQGVDVRLAPQPLAEARQCYYQTMTGMGAGKLGRFDAVQPENYSAKPVGEDAEGALGHQLPDLLRTRKLTVLDMPVSGEQELAALTGQSYDVAILRVRQAGTHDETALDALLQQCIEATSSSSHLMVLTSVSSGPTIAQVNINNFLVESGLMETAEPRAQASITWSETLAYGLGTGQVWINLRGRESQGVVRAGKEVQEVSNALIQELTTNWLDPQTKQPVVERVYKKDELYSGDYLFKAPDLTVVFRPGYSASERAFALDLDGQSVQPAAQPAQAHDVHAPYARLIARGPSFEAQSGIEAQLVDVVPTILYLLGQSVPQQVDGNVIEPLFTQAYREQVPLKRATDDADELSDEEEGMIVDRLRDLGYLG
jgi:hypothetical protein